MDRGRLQHASLRAETVRKLMLKGLQMEMMLGERGVGGWTEAVREACFRVSLKHADGDDPGENGGSRGWAEVVYEA